MGVTIKETGFSGGGGAAAAGAYLELHSLSTRGEFYHPYDDRNYVAPLGLGTPAQYFYLIVDISSPLTWTQCLCERCYKQHSKRFRPSESRTFVNCTAHCGFRNLYGEGIYSKGRLAKDTLTLGPDGGASPGFMFGCGQNNSDRFGGADGIFGLGRGHNVSFVFQSANKYEEVFSYCLPSSACSPGHLAFGKGILDRCRPKTQFLPLLVLPEFPWFYALNLTGVKLAGESLPIEPSLFMIGGSVIDLATNFTSLPPTAYAVLRDAFQRQMNSSGYRMTRRLEYLDTCYDLTEHREVKIPKLSFVFAGDTELPIHPSGILAGDRSNQTCLAFSGNEKDEDFNVIGSYQQKTYQVVYDVGGGRVGFSAGACH